MKKVFIQAILIILLFLTLWFTLRKADWMTIFKVEKITKTTEQKLGDLFWELYNKTEKEIKYEKINQPLDSLLSRICGSNHIDKGSIKLHLIKSEEVNAFALPNNHLVVFTGLILASENEAALCGVLAHEIAHLELNHVMKKLIKEVGLSVIISMTTGNGSSEKIKEAIKLLSSSAYDRNLEKEADIKAVDYLVSANIDPEGFSRFLKKMAEEEDQRVNYFSWISTHPDSKERAAYIAEYGKDKVKKETAVISPETWAKLKAYLKGN